MQQHSPHTGGSPQDPPTTSPGSRLRTPVRGHPDTASISALSKLSGWRRTGRHAWTLGNDDRLPRLTAQTRDEHAWLTLAPPIDEQAAAAWDMSDEWSAAMKTRRFHVVEAEVGHAYETCSVCDCPLRDLSARQTCPACGNTTTTRSLPEAARRLVTVSVPFVSESALAAAADELTSLFARLTQMLQARLSRTHTASSHPAKRWTPPQACQSRPLSGGAALDSPPDQQPV